MINFLLRVWTAIEVALWLKDMRDREKKREDDIRSGKRRRSTVRTKNRSRGSSVLDDVPFEEERHQDKN